MSVYAYVYVLSLHSTPHHPFPSVRRFEVECLLALDEFNTLGDVRLEFGEGSFDKLLLFSRELTQGVNFGDTIRLNTRARDTTESVSYAKRQ